MGRGRGELPSLLHSYLSLMYLHRQAAHCIHLSSPFLAHSPYRTHASWSLLPASGLLHLAHLQCRNGRFRGQWSTLVEHS